MVAKKRKEPLARPAIEGEKFRVSSKVTSKWQITVPKAVRDYFGLRPGQDLVFIGTREEIVVKRHVELPPPGRWKDSLINLDLLGTDVDEWMEELRGR